MQPCSPQQLSRKCTILPTSYFLQFDPLDNGCYYSSPADSIVFANTGMDGIHYSFLTDFGIHTNLEQAPIICVSPMDFDNCVRIVARNLYEFFELHFAGHESTRPKPPSSSDACNSSWLTARRADSQAALRLPDSSSQLNAPSSPTRPPSIRSQPSSPAAAASSPRSDRSQSARLPAPAAPVSTAACRSVAARAG